MFASLKERDYRYLWAGMLASAFALNMQLVAQGWLVYEMTNSAVSLTWVTLAFMLPQVLFSLVGGVLADRLPKKPVMGWAPVINGIVTIAMAFNTASWNLSRILGPALAGFLIAIFADGDTSSTFGVGLVYFLLSGLYMISAVTVLFLKHEGKPVPGNRLSPLAETREGLILSLIHI